jgi:hypothetical protein
MSIPESRRIALHHAAASSWGEEVADTLIESIAPAGHELATRADLQREFGVLRHELHTEIGSLRQELHTEVESLRQEMRAMHHELLATIERRVADAITSQTRVIVISMLTAVVAIAALAIGLG